jgi:phospholipase C
MENLDRDGQLGFRTPCLLFSPYARRNSVSSIEFDHTSVLRFIEWRWNLEPLTVRDETANNLAQALDFALPSCENPDTVVLAVAHV